MIKAARAKLVYHLLLNPVTVAWRYVRHVNMCKIMIWTVTSKLEKEHTWNTV